MEKYLRKIFTEKLYVYVLIIISSLLLSAAAYIYYVNEEQSVTLSKRDNLKAIASMKIKQVTDWYSDEIHDAELISQSIILNKKIFTWLRSKKKDDYSELDEYLDALTQQHGYENIILTGIDDKFLISSRNNESVLDDFNNEKINQEIKIKTGIVSSIFYCPVHKKIHLNFLSPIQNSEGTIVSVMIFQIDPDEFLFPLIQSWPTPSRTSETLLLKKEKNNVLFINELRHKKNTALKLKIPLTSKDVSAVKAVSGVTGFVEGVDYRGKKVLSYLSPVPGTDWYMVAKIDQDELYEDLVQRTVVIVVFTFLLIFLMGSVLALIYTYFHKNIYKILWKSQEEFRIALYSIGDAVITTDNNGIVQYLNPIAEKLTGWTEKESSGRLLEEIFNIISEETRDKVESPVRRVLKEGIVIGLANHTLLISKAGIEIPIADSGAPIRNDQGGIIGVVLVFRDQTDERAKQKTLQESEERFRLLSENTSDIVWTLPIENVTITENPLNQKIFTYFSPSIEKLLGYHPDEASKIPLCKNMSPESYKYVLDLLTQESNKPIEQQWLNIRIELEIFKKDRTVIDAEIIINAVRDSENNVKYLQGNIRDISERKHSERMLRLLKHSIDNASDAAFWFDSSGSFTYVNDAACKSLGYTQTELMQMSLFDVNPSSTREELEELWKILPGMKMVRIESEHRRKDGTTFPVEISSTFVSFANKEYLCGFARDITERKLAEEDKVMMSEMLNTAPNSIMIHDFEGNLFYVNEKGYKMHGYEKDEFMNLKLGEIDSAESAAFISERIKEIVEKNETSFEVIHRRKDGSIFPLEVFAKKVNWKGNNAILSIGTDITERKHIENALTENEEIFRNFLEYSPIYVFFKDAEIRAIKLSKNFERMIGRPINEMLGKTMNELFPSDLAKSMVEDDKKVLREGKLISVDEELDGKYYTTIKFPIYIDSRPTYLAGFTIDITESKLANEKIVRALKEKETLLRELYHRTKNNMQVIRSLLVLQATVNPNTTAEEFVQAIEPKIQAMSLVHQMLYQSKDLSKIDLKDYIADLSGVAIHGYNTLPDQIKLIIDLQSVPVLIDSALPCGLVINEILSNAVKHAFPQNRKGEIRIKLRRVESDTIELLIGDNGIGVQRGFDFRNQSTLGLQTIFTLIEDQLKGEVKVDSFKGLNYQIRFKDNLYSSRV